MTRIALSIAPEPNPGIISELGSMDPEPCGIPHHQIWRSGGSEIHQCPQAVQNRRVRCVHSDNLTLKAAVTEAQRRRLVTAIQGLQLQMLLMEPSSSPAWETDMLAVKLGHYAHLNQAGTTYDVAHVQWLSGLPRDELPIETLTPEMAMRLMYEAQVRATQTKEDVRQILLKLFEVGEPTPELEGALDAIIERALQGVH